MTPPRDIGALLFALCRPLDLVFAIARIIDPSDVDHLRAVAGRTLSAAEQSLWSAIRSEKRRVEFLAGRIAAKRALGAPRFGMSRGASILRDPSGAPRIAGREDLFVSISHTNPYAVAVVSARPVGVDVEADDPRPAGLSRYFFSHREKRLLFGLGPEPMRRTVNQLWSRKEAVSKVVSLGGALPFNQLDCSGPAIRILNRNIGIQSGATHGFVAAVAFEKEG
jgi:4'-phosphopantetheinyl transferase